MIATHNIKVNGRWYRAGEEYEPEVQQAQMPIVEQAKAEPEVPRTEVKPKSTTRRKASK